MILLDFRKAYDTLDRTFVHEALLSFGYGKAFADLVDRLHDHTRAQFLVNGELSKEIDIVTGIRQGCPLAPLLFLIAAETLKHMIDQEPRLTGITLNGTVHDHVHSFSAFVDDSVVFLEQGAMVEVLDEVLKDFAAVSGLHVQPHKCHAIVLNPKCKDQFLGSFPIVPSGKTVTYLGTEMGLADLDEANWAKRADGVEKRLGILSNYATGVADRVQVINLACTPSLLFTAQFFTPPPAIQCRLDSLWRQFVWNGTAHKEPRRAHKVAGAIMHLPRAMGGIGLVDYRAAMLTQAATTILSWNSRRHDKYWEAQHDLLRRRLPASAPPIISTYPSTRPPVRPARVAGGDDLMVLGYHATNHAITHCHPQPLGLVEAKQHELQLTRSPWRGLQWMTSTTGRLQLPQGDERRTAALAQLVYAQLPAELRTFWPTFPWYDNAWVVDGAGNPLKRAAYPFIRIHTLGDLGLVQTSPTTYFFSNPGGDIATMRSSTREKLAEWLRIMIANSPALPLDDSPADNRRAYSRTRHPTMDAYEWRLLDAHTLSGASIASKWNNDPHSRHDEVSATVNGLKALCFDWCHGSAQVHSDLDTLRDLEIYLDGHPGIHHGPLLLASSASKEPSRATHRCTIKAHAQIWVREHQEGLSKLVERLRHQAHVHPTFAAALQSITVARLRKQPWGVTTYQHFTRYRLTLGALNLRDQNGSRMSCPFEFCGQHGPLTLAHVFWECTGAQTFWTKLLRCWQPIHTHATQETALAHILACTTPPVARSFRQALEAATTDAWVIGSTVKRTWMVITSCAIQQLWLARNAAAFQSKDQQLPEHTATILAAVTHQLGALSTGLQSKHSTRTVGKLVDVIAARLLHEPPEATPADVEIRLYFDGGARGNPGVTGSGAILLERRHGHEWEIVWWDAHYLRDDGTNNEAEHMALLRGVTECASRYENTAVRVDIIGDSQLILAHAAGTSQAHNHTLRTLCQRTHTQLRKLFDYAIHHTLRNGNKMADWLANYAMDQKHTTTAPTEPLGFHSDLCVLVDGDTSTTWTKVRPTPTLIDDLQRHQTTTINDQNRRKRRIHQVT